MKKIIILLIVSIAAMSGFSQPISNRGSVTITVQDARLKALYNFVLPSYNDTTSNEGGALYQNNVGLDSCGALIFTYDNNSIWKRACNPKRWVLISTGNTSGFDTVYVRAPDLGVDTTTIPGKQIIFYRRANGLTSGGIVTQSACRALQVTPAFYTINYIQYNSAATTVTVDAASVFNRIDRIVADTNALVYILKGTSTGIAPQINPSFQVSIVEIPVMAGSSCLGVTGVIIYDNGTEWDTAHTGTMTVAFRNTDNPFTGTYAAFVSSYNDSSQIVFTKPSGTDTLTQNSVFRQALYFNNPFLNQMQWQLFNGTTAVTNKIVINPYFNFLDTAEYQVSAVPASAFNVINPIFNKVVISLAGYDTSGAGGFYIDDVEFQKGINNITPNNFVDSVVMRNRNGVYTGSSATDTSMFYSIKGVLTFISNIGSGGGGGSTERFGIEDNTGIQNRSVDMQQFDLNVTNAGNVFMESGNNTSLFNGLSMNTGSSNEFYHLNSFSLNFKGNNDYSKIDLRDTSAKIRMYAEDLENNVDVSGTHIRVNQQNTVDGSIIQTFVKPSSLTGQYVIPLSVNGNYADNTGNITISGGSGWLLSGNSITAGTDFIGTTNNTSMRFRTNNAEKMVLDSNGRLGIGTRFPTYPIHLVQEISTQKRGIALEHNTADIEASGFNFLKSRGTNATPTIVSDSDYVGGVTFSPFTSAYTNTLSLGARVRGTVSSSSAPTDFFIAVDSAGITGAHPYFAQAVKMVLTSKGVMGLGNMNINPDNSSLLDMASTTRGFLMPRMTTTQKNAIVSPATGLQVYDVTLGAPYWWNGVAWVAMGGGSGGVGIDSVRQLVGSDSIMQSTGGVATLAYRTQRVFNVRNYGATGNGVTNDGPAIQAAINAASTVGGKVWIPDGIYIVSDTLRADCNCQILIPSVGFSANRTTVTIEGESITFVPNGGGLVAGATLPNPVKGAIIKSTLTTGTAGAAIMGTTLTSGANTNTFVAKRFGLEVLHNPSGTGPVVGGINWKNGNDFRFEDLMIFVDTAGSLSTAAVNNISGIETPDDGHGSSYDISHCNIVGFRTGILFGEHINFNQPNIMACYYGTKTKVGTHSSTGWIRTEWCAYDIYVAGSVVLANFNIDAEWQQIGKWYDDIATIKDSANLAKGQVFYTIIDGNGIGLDNSKFIKSGGSNLLTLTHVEGVASGATGSSWLTGGNVGVAASYKLGTTNLTSLRLITNAVQRVIVDSLGSVGFGTNTPTSSLHILNTTSSAQTWVKLENDRGSSASLGNFFYGGSTSAATIFGLPALDRFFLYGEGSQNRGLAIGTTQAQSLMFATNNLERARLFSNGTLGINTTTDSTTASAKLIVNGNISATLLNAATLQGGSSTTQTLTYKTTTGVGTTGADHIFQVGNNGATEAMRILNNGNIGINKAAPAAQLDILGSFTQGTSAAGGIVVKNSNAGGYANTLWYNDQNDVGQFLMTGSTGSIASTPILARQANFIGTGTNGIGFFAGNAAGIITLTGGGSATAHVTLSAAGAMRFHTYGVGTATFDANGNITSVSDERLKTSISPYKTGLKELLKINPISYKWNKKSGLEMEHTYAGFSAQNVKANIPLSTGENKDGYLSLQDRAIIATLVNAVKELAAKVEALEAENKKLKGIISEKPYKGAINNNVIDGVLMDKRTVLYDSNSEDISVTK